MAAPDVDLALQLGDGDAAARQESFLDDLRRQTINLLLPLINEETSGKQKFANVCEYLEDVYKAPGDLARFGEEMRQLDIKAASALADLVLDETPVIDVVPAKPLEGSPPLRCQLRLWQMSFREHASMKGASNLCDILDIVQRNLVTKDGNHTAKYPLEVLFHTLESRCPGVRIEDFSIGMSIGFGTTLAAFLVAKAAIDLDWSNQLSEAEFKLVAPKLIKVIRLNAIYDPADNLVDQIKKSLGGKIQAANRQRPTTLQMLTCFQRLVDEHMRGSTRKNRPTVLWEVIRDYNKAEKIRTCKINPDEISTMKFLMSRGPEFLHMLKVVWGTERTSNTACPLNLLASPFLDASKELAVTQRDNPTWHAILMPTEEKCISWLHRVHGRFMAKVQDTVAKGKAPNLRNYGHLYRDSEPELVWRLSCLYEYVSKDVVRVHSPARVAELEAMFRRGALDKDMIDKVRLMDADFNVNDLRFLQDAEGLGVQVSSGEALNAAEREQCLAEFKVTTLKLQAEQAQWKRFLAARMEFDDSTQATLTSFREAAHDAMEKAVKEHSNTFFSVECLANRGHMVTYFEQSIKVFAENPPATPVNDILRVNVFNLPMLGQAHSRLLPDITESIRVEAAHHPITAISVVFLPNTSEWGQGMQAGRQLTEKIALARANVIAKLSEEVNSLVVVECVAMFDVDTMYSTDRELRVDFILAFSNQVDAGGKLQSIFTKSALVKRRGVPGLVPVFPRKSFLDWTKAIMVHDHGNMDASTERRQWLSGSGLFRGIMLALFKDLGATTSMACQVRDCTPYDDQLALAVMELRCSDVQGSLPRLGYVAGTWKDILGSYAIRANMLAYITEHLIRMVKSKKYMLPGFRDMGPEPKIDEKHRPTIQEDSFKVCCPRANDELPIRQALYDQWATNPVTGSLWKDLVAGHDKEFNKSGVPFKAKRSADVPLLEVAESNAITIAPDPACPATKEALLAASKGQEVQASKGPFEFVVTESGELYITATDDVVADKKEPLFLLRGRFKVGQAANALMGAGDQWVAWQLTDDSMVQCEAKPALSKPFPMDPQPLHKFIVYLESEGHVRTKLHMHDIKRRESQPGRYDVQTTETAVLEMKANESGVKMSIQTIGNYMDMKMLKASKHVHIIHKLVFDSANNKITCNFPGVFLKENVRIKKGALVKLT